jgi:uncharacterized protein YcbK (DUF882 family)
MSFGGRRFRGAAPECSALVRPRGSAALQLTSTVIGLIAVLLASTSTARRFYFSGDGALDLYNAHSGEHLVVRYRDGDGRYDSDALARIQHFFRSRSDGKSAPVSLRLIELIDFVQDRARPERLTLVSGYRSPELNQSLRAGGRRVAQASLHTEGLAADLQPQGVDLRRLWVDLRGLELGGVGLYQADGFIHLDTGRARFWEAGTSGVEKNLSAGNARIFARTDFDRYADLQGAVVRLHDVTALPLRIRRVAHIGDDPLTLEPIAHAIAKDGDCYVIVGAAEAYAFRIATSLTPPARRAPLRLQTCAPRIGATPREIVTNPVERLP